MTEATLRERSNHLLGNPIESAKRFAEAVTPAIEVIKQFSATMQMCAQFLDRLKSLQDILDTYASSRLDLQPSQRYAIAYHPYGRNTRGKKKWLLEMKRRCR